MGNSSPFSVASEPLSRAKALWLLVTLPAAMLSLYWADWQWAAYGLFGMVLLLCLVWIETRNSRLFRARAEEIAEARSLELTAKENHLDAIQRASPLGVMMLDSSGRCLDANPRAEVLLGVSRCQLLSARWTSFVHTDDRERTTRKWRACLESGLDFHALFRLTHLNSEVVWVNLRAAPTKSGGLIHGWVATIEDITQRMYAEDSLRLSEARKEAILEAALDTIITINQSRVILSMNPAGERTFGYARGDLIGKDLRIVIPPRAGPGADRNVSDHTADAFMMTGNVREVRCRRKDGSFFPAELSVSETVVGSERYYTGILRDISARKKMEDELRRERNALATRVAERTTELSLANAELERANRLKDEFLASMSHELRTPLNAILSGSEAMREGVYGAVNSAQAEGLKVIEESGKHLLALINDILDLSKIEAGKMELDLQHVPIDDICNSALQFVRQQAYKKKIKLISTPDPLVGWVHIDPRRVKQALVNLLGNAVKFTHEGGTIELRVQGDKEREVFSLTVRDTGIGISTEHMHLLFKPFGQIDGSLSRQHGGTGLGLSLVARLTELHGGSVEVRTAPGTGSEFSMHLPWNSLKVVDEVPLNAENPDASKIAGVPVLDRVRVLVADDREHTVVTLRDYLHAFGCEVVIARSPEEAIQFAEEHDPDVILTDVQMPGMNGLDLIRTLRANQRFLRTPIVALTALAMPQDREQCLAAGADEYMAKPIGLRILGKTIATLLRGGITH